MSTTLSPDRATFRALVADVAARAKEKLPQAVNGRVESAVKLVLMGDVQPQTDGTIRVGSSSDPSKTYLLAGHACDCQDFAHKAPDGWCCHRIAAGIAKRVGELLPPTPSPEVTPPALAPLGEAPASVNVRLTIGGREVQLTLRDADEGRLLARLETVLHRFPIPATAAEDTRQCPRHHVPMQVNHKDGRSWWSHKTDQGWCQGR
jgi:hypothetical protein